MHHSLSNLGRDYAQLVRAKVSLMVAAATAFGYLLVEPAPSVAMVQALAGTILLSWGCSAWNQVQEIDLDALLPRTKNRPLPAGRLGVARALGAGLLCVLLAFVCLFAAGGIVPLLAGGVIVLVYNGVYTPLKRRSAFALLVGALVGALPPVVGWVCAGGHVLAPELFLLYGVYVLWQVPHFWLRVQHDAPAYAAAGLPVPAVQFSEVRYTRLLRVWFHAYAAAMLLLPVFPFIHSISARVGLAFMGIAMFVGGSLFFYAKNFARKLLWVTDGGMLVAMGILVADRLFAL
ncbi:protoheme IX farnesyltransferase [Desulfovibrio cuneatus]|uniref:protoheme IX farnesyltransferase n=1 Tax=Desulfovibrio cuneatus TaxID=159728 RepID=UPI0004136B1A|nr:protoheme IX farnesyltransferase [Desulfovibrio cuneatus]